MTVQVHTRAGQGWRLRSIFKLAATVTVDTLLDAASYGTRWVLLSPAPAAGVARVLRPRAPGRLDPEFKFEFGSSPLPGSGRAGPGRAAVTNGHSRCEWSACVGRRDALVRGTREGL